MIFGRLQLAANGGDWPAIIRLHTEVDLSTLETDDGALLEAFVVLARAKLGQIREPKAETAALLQKYRDEPIIPIVLYELAVHERDGVWATELFKAAFAKRDRGNSATRMMLARLAEREDDAEKIIELLDGQVDVTQDFRRTQTISAGICKCYGPPSLGNIHQLTAICLGR